MEEQTKNLTPVEKEIRFAAEREENPRREKGMSKSYSSDCVQGKGRPVILNPGNLCREVDEKRKMLDPRHGGKLVTSKSADWRSEDPPSVIILETSNLIIRSASEFNLNSSVETQEKTFLNNPFFKLRSRSTLSLVDEEIKMVKQREEELKRQRASIYTKEKFLGSPSLLDSSYDKQGVIPFSLLERTESKESTR
uniref:Uncharacterized protein n=1 Tax=Pygocentrus nattereri TaxID=42514 RepID=A0AAR2L9X1_PYGNA